MNAYPEKQHYTADDLAAIIAILRDPDNGCPWDKVQNASVHPDEFSGGSLRGCGCH